MKKFMKLALVLLSSIIGLSAENGFAAKKLTPSRQQHRSQQNADESSKLGTSFKLSGINLRGKYGSPLNGGAKVESDKYLEDLLGGRKQFQDRDQKELERN